jgi:hypothetical protein
MQKKPYHMILFISLLISGSLACGLLNQANQVKQQVQSAATQIEGIVTQAPGLIATGKAIATENPGLLQTGQALLNQQGPGLVATIQALATEQPGLVDTLTAFATDNPSLANTAIAMASQIAQGSNPNAVPGDIPLPTKGSIEQLNSTAGMIAYYTTMKYVNVVKLYKTGMVNYGWKAVQQGTTSTSSTTMLVYTKDNRTASIVITLSPNDNKTGVVITIQTK